MFRESPVDAALNRLSNHFGARLVVHPPATAEMLAELEEFAGLLPRELTIFLTTCNGLRIHADGPDTELHLWGSPEVLAFARGGNFPPAPVPLLPVRGDPTGERDWLVTGHGPAGGAVIRWDPWIPGAELIATNFGAYIVAWATYVVARYGSTGTKSAIGMRAAFDQNFVRTLDAPLADLAHGETIRDWLHQLDHAVACGDDFE